MIDNITGHFSNREMIQRDIIEQPDFKPSANIDYLDGEIRTRYANIKNLIIRDAKTFTEIKGSLHTFHNVNNGLGMQNWNDLSFSQILESIEMMEHILHCHASEIVLTNFEFGFNLETRMNPSDFLGNTVIFYKYWAPCEDHKNDKSMRLIKFIYENFIQKLYDKSKQYSLHKDILRLEIVYRTKDIFSKFGIVTLDDLRNKDCYVRMLDDYLTRFDRDFVMIDSFNGDESIPNKDRIRIVQYTNPAFWIDLKRKSTSYNDINRYKKHFNELIACYRLDSQKLYLRGMLMEKFNTLLDS